MYKLTRPDGLDFYTGTINYRDAIGSIIRIIDYDRPESGACGKGLHASRNPNDCFIGGGIPCAAFRVNGIQRIAGDKHKSRYRGLKIIEEILDLDTLFGWKYSIASDPVNPFAVDPPKITDSHIALLKEWDLVRASVAASVSFSEAGSVVAAGAIGVSSSVMASVSTAVNSFVVDSLRGSSLRAFLLMESVERSLRAFPPMESVEGSLWASVVASAWAYMGSLFPNIKKWKYISHKKGVYPYQSCVDLWNMGLVPSFDGKTWRLHGGKDSGILYERH